jgi:hypothetical protein
MQGEPERLTTILKQVYARLFYSRSEVLKEDLAKVLPMTAERLRGANLKSRIK